MSELTVPNLAGDGLRLLKDEFPLVSKKLSWQHIDLLTRPCRDKIEQLEAEKTELKHEVDALERQILDFMTKEAV